MEEVIDRLLEGNFDYENGSLDFSCAKLEFTIQKGEILENSFVISSGEGRYTRGRVTSSDFRMECQTPDFVGSEAEIHFCFHGEYLEEGDVVKGEFHVISNQGEYYLPFVITVEYSVLTSSLGNIKNLFHFTNLAKVSPQEALNLFYSPDFYRILNGSDKQYYPYYRALCAYPGNERNVEEFLIGIGKKQKIEYLTNVSAIELTDPEGVIETGVNITRNGWGYTRLKVETEGSFLYTEKEELRDHDFLGNTAYLSVYVDESLLHEGNNYGCLRLYDGRENIEIPVRVSYHGAGMIGGHEHQRKHRIYKLLEYYQAFRIKRIGTGTWLKESGRLVEQMTAADGQDVGARLFQAQLLITEERYNEAQWVLEQAMDLLERLKLQDPVLKGYYLYLTTLIRREEAYVDSITEQVEQLYRRNKGAWQLAWLLLYLSEEYNKSFTKKWMFLEEQFNRGCNSPVLYLEAMLLLTLSPALLIKLDGFERQVLLYGAKNRLLNEDVIRQFVYLVAKEREYSLSLYRILETCYELWQDDSVLQEICSLLIKGNRAGKKYFIWYERGVQKELRITRLYEYFMMSVDRDSTKMLPKIVLMYFTYQNSLHYELTAFLYANAHRFKNEISDLYDSYRGPIEQFVTEQILKRRINRDLAYLYKHVLTPQMLTAEISEALSELLFLHYVETSRKDIRYVLVYEQGMEQPGFYPMADGKALIPLVGTESRLMFEDNKQNRYVVSVPHITEKLLLPAKLVKLVAPYVGDDRTLNLYLCMNGRELAEITEENERRFGYLLADELIEDEIRREIGMKLMQYYYEHDRIKELDEYLDIVEPDVFTVKERNEILRYLVLRGKEEKAYEWLSRFGPYGMDPKVLVRLCAKWITDNEYVEDKVLTDAVQYAFWRGKYDERGLRYLTLHFVGLTKELRDIWKAAVAFGVPSYELCEKMLIQMLFSGSFVGEKMEIFRAYVAGGAKVKVEIAFLSQCAYEYFVKDRLTESYVFEEMARIHRQGEELHRVCKLGFVKYYSENKSQVTPPIQPLLTEFIKEFIKNRIHLKMFGAFPELGESGAERLGDRTIVEYKAHPGARAFMHYCVEQAKDEDAAYKTEEMQEVYGGVCFKDFVLFFGERLQYYIMEEWDGNEQLTESATLQKSDTGNTGLDGKFGLINDLSISTTLQDYETVDRLLAEYEYKEFMRNGLFKLS